MKITLLLIHSVMLFACNSGLNNAIEAENSKAEPENPLKENNSLNHSMGKGIMELALRTINYYHQDFLVFKTDSTENVVELHDQPGWNLKINYRDYTGYITAFNTPNYARHYQFIWLSGEQNDKEIIIKSYGDTRTYKVSNPGRFSLIPWENYLLHRYIALEPGAEIYRSANSQAKRSSLDKKTSFKVAEVQGHWIKVYPVTGSKNKGKFKRMETAWLKWHTHGKLHIRFLNDIEM